MAEMVTRQAAKSRRAGAHAQGRLNVRALTGIRTGQRCDTTEAVVPPERSLAHERRKLTNCSGLPTPTME